MLPFDNLGGDDATARLADGITEDIITDLARFPEFEVVSRNSTGIYKGKAVDMRQVGKDLGVGYVLEGSFQRQGERLRATVQLIDAKTGTHIWSNRWDRPVEEVFALQTELAEQVANRLGSGAGLIQEAGRKAAKRKRPENLNAYELYLLGTEKLEQVTKESIDESIRLLKRAVELDPTLARAWVELHWAYQQRQISGPTQFRRSASRGMRPNGRSLSIPAMPRRMPHWAMPLPWPRISPERRRNSTRPCA